MINLSENSYAAFVFLKMKLNGINAKPNTKGGKESHWKIPCLISTSPNSEFPQHSITFHFSILFTNKLLMFSATPNKYKHSIIHECGTISQAFL